MIFEKDKIIKILNNDGIIAFVTDTVWGIGCLPTSERGCKRIYEIKKGSKKTSYFDVKLDLQLGKIC